MQNFFFYISESKKDRYYITLHYIEIFNVA